MNVFENIKVGDFVYSNVRIFYGLNGGKYFEVKELVGRVTKTQFITSSGMRCRKSDGGIIGKFNRVKLDGKDETKEMNEYKETLRLIDKIERTFRNMGALSHKTLLSEAKEVYQKTMEIEVIISELINKYK